MPSDVNVYGRITIAEVEADQWAVLASNKVAEESVALLIYTGEGAEARAREHAELIQELVSAPIE